MTAGMAAIGGAAATFANLLIWDEAAFAYVEIVRCEHGRDVRAEFIAMHDPPLVIVRVARFDGRSPLRPAA